MEKSQPVRITAVKRLPILVLLVAATLVGSFLLLGLMLNIGSEENHYSLLLTFLGLPLIIFVIPLFMFGGEKRKSRARPRLLEFFLAGVGAVFPPAILTALMWVLWWILYGLVFLFAPDDPFGVPFNAASTIVAFLALGLNVFLVRVNWRNLIEQLYPVVGNTSAFAKLSRISKRWLLKRGLVIVALFLISGFIIIIIIGFFGSTEGFSILDQFLFTLFLFVVQLFLVSLSAWLWLRKPPVPQGLEVAQELLGKMLTAQGYEVYALPDLIHHPEQQGKIDEAFVASIDLIARKDDHSMVIDILTSVETLQPPDWNDAAAFKTAVWYLSSQLNLPAPIEARFFLVDITPEDSLLAFTTAYDIQIQHTTNDMLLDALANDETWQQMAASWFKSALLPEANDE